MSFAAIDFGTSNSAVALSDGAGGVRLVALEDGLPTMPTAVFYRADAPVSGPAAGTLFGRAALAAYVEGQDGRLMRSMKSLLGSSLLDQGTEIGTGRSVRYREVVAGYLRELRRRAATVAGAHDLATARDEPGGAPTQVVLGRPVCFVDDDPARDAQAQAALERAAHEVGFTEVRFQYEPIAAALDHEARATREQRVLVADIGGGTSDFALVRVGPARRGRAERRDDILAAHGVHVAGTDFDRHVALGAILPLLGHRSRRAPRRGEADGATAEVPSGIYHDLATWHLIHTAYAPARVAELRAMKGWYRDPRHHARLVTTLQERLGHALVAAAEQAKIDVAGGSAARIDLALLEPALQATLHEADAAAALEADLARIVDAADETVRRAGVAPGAVDALYFTGGSTGLAPLVQRIGARFPAAERVQGERFASVARGLGQHARALFGGG